MFVEVQRAIALTATVLVEVSWGRRFRLALSTANRGDGEKDAVVADTATPTVTGAFQLDDVTRERTRFQRPERGANLPPVSSGKPCELLLRRSCDEDIPSHAEGRLRLRIRRTQSLPRLFG